MGGELVRSLRSKDEKALAFHQKNMGKNNSGTGDGLVKA